MRICDKMYIDVRDKTCTETRNAAFEAHAFEARRAEKQGLKSQVTYNSAMHCFTSRASVDNRFSRLGVLLVST